MRLLYAAAMSLNLRRSGKLIPILLFYSILILNWMIWQKARIDQISSGSIFAELVKANWLL